MSPPSPTLLHPAAHAPGRGPTRILAAAPARAAAAAMARLTGARVLERRLDDRGAGRSLDALARREAADLVVVAADGGTSADLGRLVRPALASGFAVLAIPPGARPGLRLDRIGVAYDGGAAAERALACTVDLVRLAGAAVASLDVAYVDDRDSPLDQPDARGLQSARDAMIEWWLGSLGGDVPALVRPLRLEGDPTAALADLSQDLDLLVVGTRPRGWLRRLLTGSVAAELVTQTHCALLVVPEHMVD